MAAQNYLNSVFIGMCKNLLIRKIKEKETTPEINKSGMDLSSTLAKDKDVKLAYSVSVNQFWDTTRMKNNANADIYAKLNSNFRILLFIISKKAPSVINCVNTDA